MSSPSALSPYSHSARKRKKSRNRQSQPLSRIFDEPPQSIFPSGEEILKLLVVLTIATFVAVVCHYVFRFLGRKPKPFCDISAENNLDLVSGICHLFFAVLKKSGLYSSFWPSICTSSSEPPPVYHSMPRDVSFVGKTIFKRKGTIKTLDSLPSLQ